MIVKTNVFGAMEEGRVVLGLFYISSMSRSFLQRPPTFVLERLSLVKIALIANRVFFKNLSRSIYTRLLIRSGGEGVLKCKNY